MKHINRQRYKGFLRLIALFTVLLTCGCVGNTYWAWEHSDNLDSNRLAQDRQECQNLAKKEVEQYNFFYNSYNFPFYPRHFYYDRYGRSYFGWRSHYEFLRYQDDLKRYFRICMQAKGWQWVKKEPDKEQPDSSIPHPKNSD